MADLPTPAPKPDLSQIPNGALNGAAAQLAAQSGPRFVLPHMQQFQAVWKTPAGTYRFSFDEALKRSHTDALAMRRDGHLIHLLQARYLPVLGADWHIKADDEQDEERAKTYQALLEKTPRFLQLRKCLLEAVWFGRYGVQLAFGTIEVNGRQMQGITAWRPVNGDKINFREDGTPTVRINPAFAARLRDDGATIEDAEKHPHTAWNDQGTVLVLDQPRYRQRFAIHVHEVEDADFSEPELAGGVGGVGLRHYCYWVWWLRQEVMEWLLNYLEMMGAGGLTIVGYDAGNPKGLDLAQQAFEERATVVYLPIPPGQEKQTNLVQRIEPSGTGNDIFHGWIDGYFNAILTRLIIGQDLSSQSSGTGLGSGVADLQADVKQCIHRYDARNLNETETQQLLNVLIALNEPSGNTNLRCETVLKEKEPEKALQAAKQAFDMGAELPESFVVKTAGIPEPKKGERLLSQAQQQQQQEALTSAVAGGHASAAGIGLGEMRNYLDAQGIPEEEQLHHLADMVDGGELQEIDTDDGVKYVEAGQYQDTPPSQDQPKTYAKEDWIEETGPRGGKRWTNRKSGTVQYKEPGEGRTGPKDAQIEEPAQEGDKPVAKLRKGMVAQGAYQYADKALRGESNKTLEGEGVLAHVVNLDKRLVKSQVVSLAAQHGMPVSASTTKTRALAFIEDKLRGHLDAHLKQQKGGKAGKERVDSEEAGGAASPAVGANQAQGTMPAASPALPGQATPAPTAEGEYPASAPPGSEERIRLMAERAAQKKPLFGQEEKPNVVQTNAGGFPEAAPARDGTPEVLGQGGSGGGEHPGERAVLEDGAGGGTEAGQEQGQEEGHLPPRQDETLNQYCKRAGIQEAYPHVKAHALQLHQLQREQVDKHNDIVRTAMKALKKESGLVTSRLVAQRGKDGNVDTAKGERAKDDLTKWNKLWSKAKDGGDYASLPGFDQITREIASEHTDLFKGAYRTEGGDDSTGTALDDQEKLFGMLVEGVRPVPDFREAEDQALQDYEESRANHRRATGESADNAESGDTSFEPEFMGEDEAREHLAEHLTPEEMPGTMEAAQENQDAILQGDAPDSGAAEHDRADEGGAQPRQGEEDRASPGEGEREGQGQSPYAQKVDELPPIPEGHGRLTHVTTKQGVDQILKGGLDYSRQGIDATTDIHNGNESIHDLAKTGNVAGTGFNRNKFGDQVVLSDLSEDEYRKHADLTGGAPGSIHPSRIVGHIDRTTGKFTPNPQYNPNAQVDVGSSAPEPMPVGPRARRPGSGGTAPISGAESVPVPVPSGKAEVWGDEEAPDFREAEDQAVAEYDQHRPKASADNVETGDADFNVGEFDEHLTPQEVHEHLTAEGLTPEESLATIGKFHANAIEAGNASPDDSAQPDAPAEGGPAAAQGAGGVSPDRQEQAKQAPQQPREVTFQGQHPGTMSAEDMLDEDAHHQTIWSHYAGGASSRTTPLPNDINPPVGTWRRSSFNGMYGHGIEQLREVPVGDLTPTENLVETNAEGRGWDADRYAEWIKEGKEPPAIHAVETNEGGLNVTNGHRRLAAHKLAGKSTIKAWISPTMPSGTTDPGNGNRPNYTGLTHEAAQYHAQGMSWSDAAKKVERDREEDGRQMMERLRAKSAKAPAEPAPEPQASDFMQPTPAPGPHTPESVAESAGQSFTNDKGLTVDVRKNADGTWNVGSLTNVSRAAVANYLNSHGAIRAKGLFRSDVTAQAPAEKPKEKLEWAAPAKQAAEGAELPGMKDTFAPGMFGQVKTEEEAKPTESKTTHPLGHYSRTTEDGTSVEPLREGERPISQTIRVQHAKGYRGKLGNTSYVAKINGTSSRYGLEREFQKADRMDWGDSKLFKKNKGVYHAEHDVPPQGGVYEVNEHGEKRFGVHVPLKWNGKSKLMEYRVGEEGLKTAYQMLERAGRKPSELVTAFVHTADQKAMKTPERVKKYLEDLEAQEPAASPNLAEIQHEPSSAPARPESPASPAATPGPAGEEATPQTESAAGEPAKADAYDRLHQKLGMPDTAFPSLRSMASATSTKQLPTYATPDAAREHVSHAYSTAPAHSPDDAKAHWERMAGLERLGKNDLADVAKAANVHIPPGTTREIAANLIRNAYARRRGASLRAEMTAPGAKGAIGQLPLLPERAEAAVKPAGNLDPVKMDVMSKPELLGHAEKMELYGLGKKSRQEIAAAIRAKLGE